MHPLHCCWFFKNDPVRDPRSRQPFRKLSKITWPDLKLCSEWADSRRRSPTYETSSQTTSESDLETLAKSLPASTSINVRNTKSPSNVCGGRTTAIRRCEETTS